MSFSPPSGGSRITTVEYTGDGAASRVIVLGFRPRLLMINDSTSNAQHGFAIANTWIYGLDNSGQSNVMTPILANGVDVGLFTIFGGGINVLGRRYQIVAVS